MEAEEYALMARVEDTHWWYQGMARLTHALLHRFSQQPSRLLDAGCGTGGALANVLAEHPRRFGCDRSALALHACRARGLERIQQASLSELPHPDAVFDLVTCFDVLYERGVPDDLAALRELSRVLRPGGILLLRVPAHDWLRGNHDRTTHTARRYAVADLRRLFAAADLEMLHLTHANAGLFPFVAAKRWLEHLNPLAPAASDLTWEAGPLAALLRWLLTVEARVAAGPGLPFGLSLVAVGQKGSPA